MKRNWSILEQYKDKIVDEKGLLIASTWSVYSQEVNQENAALIVRAVNCHDELIEMLFQAEYFIDINFSDPNKPQGRKAIQLKNQIRDLLKRAKGETKK
jgi:dihydroorotate dehydrogenase